jgi:hypothetical protein
MIAGPGAVARPPRVTPSAGAPLGFKPRGRATIRAMRTWLLARGTVTLTVIAVALTAVVVVVLRDPFGLATAHSSSTMPTSASIEAQWGVRFTQIGMVDVRYVVLDVDKAMSVATTIPATPLLIEEESERVIFAVAMKAHAHDLHTGGRYYLLYRNTNGLIAPGRQVTITLGGLQLKHVTVLGTKGG